VGEIRLAVQEAFSPVIKRTFVAPAFLVALTVGTLSARAAPITFTANLTGDQQVPANNSTATGFGTVVLDDVAHTITVDLSWSGLTADATAAHIHGPGAPGTNANIIFPFNDVPTATSGSIPEQTFGISNNRIPQLEAGLFYMNIHDANFPNGEIRGQLLPVPEPATLALVAVSFAGFAISTMRGFAQDRRRREPLR